MLSFLSITRVIFFVSLDNSLISSIVAEPVRHRRDIVENVGAYREQHHNSFLSNIDGTNTGDSVNLTKLSKTATENVQNFTKNDEVSKNRNSTALGKKVHDTPIVDPQISPQSTGKAGVSLDHRIETSAGKGEDQNLKRKYASSTLFTQKVPTISDLQNFRAQLTKVHSKQLRSSNEEMQPIQVQSGLTYEVVPNLATIAQNLPKNEFPQSIPEPYPPTDYLEQLKPAKKFNTFSSSSDSTGPIKWVVGEPLKSVPLKQSSIEQTVYEKPPQVSGFHQLIFKTPASEEQTLNLSLSNEEYPIISPEAQEIGSSFNSSMVDSNVSTELSEPFMQTYSHIPATEILSSTAETLDIIPTTISELLESVAASELQQPVATSELHQTMSTSDLQQPIYTSVGQQSVSTMNENECADMVRKFSLINKLKIELQNLKNNPNSSVSKTFYYQIINSLYTQLSRKLPKSYFRSSVSETDICSDLNENNTDSVGSEIFSDVSHNTPLEISPDVSSVVSSDISTGASSDISPAASSDISPDVSHSQEIIQPEIDISSLPGFLSNIDPMISGKDIIAEFNSRNSLLKTNLQSLRKNLEEISPIVTFKNNILESLNSKSESSVLFASSNTKKLDTILQVVKDLISLKSDMNFENQTIALYENSVNSTETLIEKISTLEELVELLEDSIDEAVTTAEAIEEKYKTKTSIVNETKKLLNDVNQIPGKLGGLESKLISVIQRIRF